MKQSIFLLAWLVSQVALAECQQYDFKIIQDFNTAVSKLKSDPGSFKNVEDFLKAIPLELRQDYILVGDSLSNQPATKDAPRVIMKSPNSELYVSFSSEPNGTIESNSVEIIQFEAKSAQYIFQEVQFDGKKAKYAGHDETSGKCVKCHTPSLRPNWDTYRAWASTLSVRGEVEPLNDSAGGLTKQYFKFLDKVVEEKEKKPNSRLAQLELPSTDGVKRAKPEALEDIRKKLEQHKRYGFSIYDAGGNNGSNNQVNFFDQTMDQMACKIAEDLKKHPNFDKFKYLIPASNRGCDVKQVFDDPKVFERTRDYFELRGLAQAEKYSDLRTFLQKDTRDAAASLDDAKLRKQKKFLATFPKDTQFSNRDREPRGVGEIYSEQVAQFRMLLEPMGVPVADWSFSYGDDFSKDYYAFADRFPGFSTEIDKLVSKEFQTAVAEGKTQTKDFCTWAIGIAKKQYSEWANSVSESEVKKMFRAEVLQDCVQLSQSPKALRFGQQELIGGSGNLNEVLATNTKMINAVGKKVFKDNCLVCHGATGSVPKEYIFKEYDKDADTAKWLASKMKGQKLSWLQRINRSTEHSFRDGAKPMPPGRMLSKSDQMFLLMYLNGAGESDKKGVTNPAQVACDKLLKDHPKEALQKKTEVKNTPKSSAKKPE